MREDGKRAPVILFAAVLGAFVLIYIFSGLFPFAGNAYNSYSLQAQSWLQGRLDLPENYAHLEIATYQGRYYISFPPFPSLVMLPLALAFGVNTPDHFIALLFALLSALYAYRIARQTTNDSRRALFFSLFLVLGTNYLHVSVWGAVWYIAQNMAFALTLMSLYYALTPGAKDSWASLFCLACVAGCRPFQMIYLPLIVYLLWKRTQREADNGRLRIFWKRLLVWSPPAVGLGLFYMALNYARFGSVFEFGHNYLPEFVEAKQFSVAYVADNLTSIFLRLPEISASGRLTFPMYNGVAFWIVSPIVLSFVVYGIASLVKNNKQKKNALWRMIPALILAHLLILSMHRTMGGHHFGNRYTVDCLPVLFVGLCAMMRDRPVRLWPHAALALWGLVVNIWGSAQYFALYR